MKRRPALRKLAPADYLPPGSRPAVVVTMSVGQWDPFLAGAYGAGFLLLEQDSQGRHVAAYQKAEVVAS